MSMLDRREEQSNQATLRPFLIASVQVQNVPLVLLLLAVVWSDFILSIYGKISNLENKNNWSLFIQCCVSLCAAGGLATYLHVDTVAAYLPQSIKIRAMADAGYVQGSSLTQTLIG